MSGVNTEVEYEFNESLLSLHSTFHDVTFRPPLSSGFFQRTEMPLEDLTAETDFGAVGFDPGLTVMPADALLVPPELFALIVMV